MLLQLLFAVGCILLKFKRAKLKRDVHAKPIHLILGMMLVTWGLLGNILLSPTVLEYFVSDGADGQLTLDSASHDLSWSTLV